MLSFQLSYHHFSDLLLLSTFLFNHDITSFCDCNYYYYYYYYYYYLEI